VIKGRALILGSVSIGLFLAALDAYVVVTLLPRMMGDLGLSAERIERATPVLTGFLLGYIVTMPISGAVSDAYGRGRVYLACLGIFALGSALTATAGLTTFAGEGPGGLPWLVAGRVLQGLGGGALVPVALALAADLYPAGERAVAIGAVAALQEIGSVLGPLYGAALATLAAGIGGWRAVFWVNLPLALICAAVFVRAGRRGRASVDAGAVGERATVDWVGAALLGGGLGLLVLALYPDDPAHRATGPWFVPAGVVAIIVLGMYVRHQLSGRHRLVSMELVRSRVFLGANLTNLLVGAALMVALVDVPILARAVFGLDQLGAALLLGRFMLAIPVGALAGGWLARRVGYAMTSVAGLAAAAAAFVAMSAWSAQELGRRPAGLPSADLTLALCGLGFGLVIAPVASAILDSSRRSEHGVASSAVVLARTTGMLLGLSALTAFGLHRFFQLFAQGPPLRLEPGSPDFNAQLAEIEARTRSALLAEYHEIFLITAGICVLAALVAAWSLRGGSAAEPGAQAT
jgi:MFS family permease